MSTQQPSEPPASRSRAATPISRGRLRYWWPKRIEGAPILRHLSLWQKLLVIVIVLLAPTVLLLRDFVSKSNEETVRMRRELCVDAYARQLKGILREQINLNGRVPSGSEAQARAPKVVMAAVDELATLSASGCGMDGGLVRVRMPEALVELRALAVQASAPSPDKTDKIDKDDVVRRMREAVATWFARLALVASETQILDSSGLHLDDATLRRLPEAAWRIERLV